MPGPKKGFAKPQDAKKTFFRLMGYLAPYKGLVLLILPALIASSSAGIFGTYMLKPIINQITGLLTTGSKDLTVLLPNLALLAAIYLAGAAGSYLANRLLLKVSTGVLEAVRCDMFEKLQKLPLNYFDTRTHGEIMSRFSSDTDTLRELLSQGLSSLLTCSITVVGVLSMMFILSPLMTVLVLVMFVLMLQVVKVVGKKSSFFFRKRQAAIAASNGYIEEMIQGQREVKVFCYEEKAGQHFRQLAENLRQAGTGATTFSMVLMPIMGNLSYVLYAAAAACGALLSITRGMDLGTIAAFLQYTRSFTQPLTQISQQFTGLLNALAGAERIFQLIDLEPEVDEGDVTLVNAQENSDGSLREVEGKTGIWAWKCPRVDGGADYVRLLGDVRFEHVTFGYDPEHKVLHDISLFAKPGQKIALVGSTGAGKTTITNLLTRFYDIQEGTITYDGIDIKRIKKDDLRHSLGMVLQDTHLFTGTVRENIRYGNLSATDEEIVAAAKLANAHSFITHLPKGYDTMLTADGTNLSQGQRQLIAIARAAVEDPPVLILDEATSSIDTRTERLIEKGMDRLMAGRTVFVIAHRLSTVRNSNAILVLEKGRVIERGDHDELLEQKGKYYELYTGMFELN
ncbi:MAG: ABC transporter ATP-binding protein [Clostridia bacterium]|nr:ABC transporter ATP-binding protein [Clostridia bacterium]